MEIKTFRYNKILSALLYGLVVAFILYIFLDAYSSNSAWAGLGYAIGLIYGGFGLAGSLVPTIIGLVRSIIGVKKGYCEKPTLIYFIIFTALPFITFLIALLVVALLN